MSTGNPIKMDTDETTTLIEAKVFTVRNMMHGVICPCCTQLAKVYRRTVTSSMAAALIHIHNHFKRKSASEWLHVPTYLSQVYGGAGVRGGDWAKLRYFDLIEARSGLKREDGSKRVGFWRITELGKEFARGKASVPEWIHVYDGEVTDKATTNVTILRALNNKFSYEELMHGTTRAA